MKLQALKIKNYKSVVNTGWCDLSIDNISSIVGQNESGKSTILQALESFNTGEVNEENYRNDNSLPEVACSFKLSESEFTEMFKDKLLPPGVVDYIKSKGWRINVNEKWDEKGNSTLIIEEQSLSDLFHVKQENKLVSTNTTPTAGPPVVETLTESTTSPLASEPLVTEPQKLYITGDEFLTIFMERTPDFILFENGRSLLPDTIDLTDIQTQNIKAEGYQGVMNFLTISGLTLDFLTSKGSGKVSRHIDGCNKAITTDFQEFWSQKIGKEDRITIEVCLQHYPDTVEGKAGKPYLEFWVKDHSDRLHPKQRSEGVRWFMSFYLQLKANAMRLPKDGSIFLIDEPGGSLHARAQEDVIKVFEDIKNKIQVIFTTHSPYMVNMNTLYRVLAVERIDEDDDNSETKVVEACHLGTASTNTLAPILDRMGVNFSNQTVIQKKNNVLLEEISALYYFTSFKELTKLNIDSHFIPCTGASNVPHMAYMFVGWGLDFIAIVDDDSAGRATYKELKENLCHNDDVAAKDLLYKLKGYKGIEEVFTKTDFKKFIIGEENAVVAESNSIYMKEHQLSKPVYAAVFMIKVKKGEITIDMLNKQTQENIKKIMTDLAAMLSPNTSEVNKLLSN